LTDDIACFEAALLGHALVIAVDLGFGGAHQCFVGTGLERQAVLVAPHRKGGAYGVARALVAALLDGCVLGC
jgi:hypothetical protein